MEKNGQWLSGSEKKDGKNWQSLSGFRERMGKMGKVCLDLDKMGKGCLDIE